MATTKNGLGLWLVNAVLLLSVLLGAWLFFQRDSAIDDAIDMQALSHLIDGRVAQEAALDPFEEQLFDGGEVIKRRYRNPAGSSKREEVWLLAVKTLVDRHAHHPPEYCYTGSGWQIVDSAPADWALADGSHPIRALARLERDGREHYELFAYWFSDGRESVDSYFQRVLRGGWQRISGQPRAWLSLRVSIPMEGRKPGPEDEALLKAFAQAVSARIEHR